MWSRSTPARSASPFFEPFPGVVKLVSTVHVPGANQLVAEGRQEEEVGIRADEEMLALTRRFDAARVQEDRSPAALGICVACARDCAARSTTCADPRDSRSETDYYRVVGDDDGVFGCMSLLGCHDICPKSLPLQTQIAFLRRRMVRAGI